MRGGGSVRPGSLGMAVSHALAWGPAWERSRPRAAGTTQAATRAREKKFERRETRGAAIHVPGARVRVPQGRGWARKVGKGVLGGAGLPALPLEEGDALGSFAQTGGGAVIAKGCNTHRSASCGRRAASTGKASAQAAQ